MLTTVIEVKKPMIIGLTESWCHKDIEDSEIAIDGYTLFRKDRLVGIGGGVLLYVSEDLKAESVPVLNSHDFEDSIWCKVRISPSKTLLIGVCYRSTNSSHINNINLIDLLNKVTDLPDINQILIMGDFNYPGIDWENMSTSGGRDAESFHEKMNDYLFIQHVKFNTRHRINNVSSRLDLIFTNEEEMIGNISPEVPLGRSDHVGVLFQLELPTIVKTQAHEANSLNFQKADYDKMNLQFSQMNWHSLFADNSIESVWYEFKSTYQRIVCDCTPIYDPTKKKPPWRKARVKKHIKKKKEKWNLYKTTGRYIDLVNYNKQNNKAIKVMREAKTEYEGKLIRDFKKNLKPFHRYMRLKQSTKSTVRHLQKADGDMTTDDIEMSNLLLEFFSSVFTKEDVSTTLDLPEREIAHSMADVVITVQEVKEALSKLKENKAPGVDGIHPKILNRCSSTVCLPLQKIFQMTLVDGSLPRDWKDANVTALHKKGSKTDVGNYRPVSLTSVPCKILEGLIRSRILEHMNINNLSSTYQHGFTERRSCLTNLLTTLEVVTKNVDDGNCVDLIYFDYKKAFDKVAHHRLLCKLKSLGLSSNVICWIEGFLSNRRQRVVINGTKSEWSNVTSGVPQ